MSNNVDDDILYKINKINEFRARTLFTDINIPRRNILENFDRDIAVNLTLSSNFNINLLSNGFKIIAKTYMMRATKQHPIHFLDIPDEFEKPIKRNIRPPADNVGENARQRENGSRLSRQSRTIQSDTNALSASAPLHKSSEQSIPESSAKKNHSEVLPPVLEQHLSDSMAQQTLPSETERINEITEQTAIIEPPIDTIINPQFAKIGDPIDDLDFINQLTINDDQPQEHQIEEINQTERMAQLQRTRRRRRPHREQIPLPRILLKLRNRFSFHHTSLIVVSNHEPFTYFIGQQKLSVERRQTDKFPSHLNTPIVAAPQTSTPINPAIRTVDLLANFQLDVNAIPPEERSYIRVPVQNEELLHSPLNGLNGITPPRIPMEKSKLIRQFVSPIPFVENDLIQPGGNGNLSLQSDDEKLFRILFSDIIKLQPNHVTLEQQLEINQHWNGFVILFNLCQKEYIDIDTIEPESCIPANIYLYRPETDDTPHNSK